MVSAALNLRGVNLAQGLKMTFGVIDPKSDEHAKELANYILKGRYLSDSFLPDWPIFRWWRHAEAVRPREVFDAIQRIALGKEPSTYISMWADIKAWWTKDKIPVPDLKNKAGRILQGLGIDSGKITEAQNAIAATGEEASKKIKEFTDAAEAAYKRFDYWTCTSQERAQQWLTMHARILTVIFAFVFAIVLQLDTVEIFKLVSSNKAVRDKLVAQAGAVEAQAAKVLGDSSTVLKDALKSWSEKETDPAIKSALADVAVKDTDTREEVRDKVAKALDGKTPKESFDSIVNDTATQRLEKQADNFRIVKADFDDSSFVLFPKDGCFWRGSRWKDGWKSVHVVGVLFSIGLLSLGAPFWYNMLKNLVNLRSQVAQNISSEQEKQKPPDTSAPPPTPTPVPAPPTQSGNGAAPKPTEQPQPAAPVGGTSTPQAPPTVMPS
jgi:hypothetical protein